MTTGVVRLRIVVWQRGGEHIARHRVQGTRGPVRFALMRLADVDASWGQDATTWVWSAKPTVLFEADGGERVDLEPVDAVLPEHYEDEVGWWTCHRETKLHDLAVIYRSGAANDPGDQPSRGPKDLCYVVLATSDARPLNDDPFAGEFADYHGCSMVVVARLNPTIPISQLRSDPAFNDFGALKTGFVRAAMSMPKPVWDRIVALDGASPSPTTPTAPVLTPAERQWLERDLEHWCEAHPEALSRLLGYPVEVVRRQLYCGDEHQGVIDLLVRRTDRKFSFVVVELKADDVRRDAVAQTLGYIGWFRDEPRVREVQGAVIGLEVHSQVPFVLKTTADLVTVHHWADAGLPADLKDRLKVAGSRYS